MAFEKKTFAPDAVANARRLYEQTQTPLDAVAASLGITRQTLASRIVEWGWTPRTTSVKGGRQKPHKRRMRTARSANPKRAKTKPEKTGTVGASPAPQQREATGAEGLAVRVQRVVERELDAIDQILGAIGAADAAEAERSARTLASLARALKEVMRLAAPDEPADADDDDPVPRDLDEFRRELARRIEALAGGGAAKTSGDGG